MDIQSLGQTLTGETRVTTQAQEEALRYAKNLGIDLDKASKVDPSLRSRWFKLFKDAHVNKNHGTLQVVYSYYSDMKAYLVKTDEEKIKLFFWKYNNPYQVLNAYAPGTN